MYVNTKTGACKKCAITSEAYLMIIISHFNGHAFFMLICPRENRATK